MSYLKGVFLLNSVFILTAFSLCSVANTCDVNCGLWREGTEVKCRHVMFHFQFQAYLLAHWVIPLQQGFNLEWP